MNNKNFYTKEQIADMKKAIKMGVNPREYAEAYSKKLGRSENSIYMKMKSLKNRKNKKFTDVQETLLKHAIFRGDDRDQIVDKYSKEWGVPRQALHVKLTWLYGHIGQAEVEEDITEQVVPTIKAPEGFLFEGTPTKVMLFKDHFRVYF